MAAFDDDPAGRAAALRSFPLLCAAGIWAHAAELPAGQDPAALLERHGPAALLAALTAAQERPLADLVIDDRVDRYRDQLRWAEGQVAAARSAATAIVSLPSAHIGRQIARLTARLDLPPATISDVLVEAACGPSHHTNESGHAQPGQGAAQLARAAFPLPLAASLTAPIRPIAQARSFPAGPNPTAARTRRPA